MIISFRIYHHCKVYDKRTPHFGENIVLWNITYYTKKKIKAKGTSSPTLHTFIWHACSTSASDLNDLFNIRKASQAPPLKVDGYRILQSMNTRLHFSHWEEQVLLCSSVHKNTLQYLPSQDDLFQLFGFGQCSFTLSCSFNPSFSPLSLLFTETDVGKILSKPQTRAFQLKHQSTIRYAYFVRESSQCP